MNEKRYLNWFNKIGYGSGDIAGNCVYALLSSFVMIYLTDTVGLNALLQILHFANFYAVTANRYASY